MYSAATEEWHKVYNAWKAVRKAQKDLLQRPPDELNKLIAHGFEVQYFNYEYDATYFAYEMLELCSDEQKMFWLPFLVSNVSSAKSGRKVQKIILSLPKSYLVENIEAAAEPTLRHNNFLDWVSILSLYEEIDPQLSVRLAKRMVHHSDADLNEWGREHLEENNLPPVE